MLLSRLVRIALLLSLMVLPAAAQPLTLTGTVSYHERIALPANSQLRVTLVRLPAANPIASATATIPPTGSAPLAFSLTLRESVDSTDDRFALVAEISSGGRSLFRTPQPVPVDLQYAQVGDVLVVFAPQAQAELVNPVVDVPDGLLERAWRVTSIGGRPVTGPNPLTLSIAADFRAGGNAGCNEFFTQASFEEERLAFGPAAATRMACPPELMQQEVEFLAALAAIGRYELDGTSLRLLDAAGIPLIGLVRDAE